MAVTYSFLLIVAIFAVVNGEDDIDWAKVFPKDLEIPSSWHLPLPSEGANTNRVVGGVEAIPNSRPYQVGLYIPVGTGTAFCGGSIITNRTILTAAHCVDIPGLNVTIVLGAHQIANIGEAHHIRVFSTDIVLHPQWDPQTLANDIALIRLSQPIELNHARTTIMLPRTTDNLYVGWNAILSGWGRPADSIGQISPVLREVTVPVVSNNVCNMAYFGFIQQSNICTSGANGKGSCNGDSGGPLVVNGVQIGVVSFGISYGCEVGWPAVYARVTHYLDWIHANWV